MTSILFPLNAASASAVSLSVETLTSLAPRVADCIRDERAADLESLLVEHNIPTESRAEAVRQFAVGFSLFRAFDASGGAKEISEDSVERMATAFAHGDSIRQQERSFEELADIVRSLEAAGHRGKAQDLISQVLEDIRNYVVSTREPNLLKIVAVLASLQDSIALMSGNRPPAGKNGELVEKLNGVVITIRESDFRVEYLQLFNRFFPEITPRNTPR